MLDYLTHRLLRLPYRLYIHSDTGKATKPQKLQATVVLLHGIGNSGQTWNELSQALPDSMRAISIDLLGFGGSPKPKWPKYNVTVQAKSIASTLIKARINLNRPIIIVGHSMGSLVAIELAKRYPRLVKSLILCSPPLYTAAERRLLPNQQQILRDLYKLVVKNPDRVVSAIPLAAKLKIVGQSFNVTADNIDSYVAALEASIINQTSLSDIAHLRQPIHIIYGRYDPLIVKKNLRQLDAQHPNISLVSVATAHEINQLYVGAILNFISQSQPNTDS